MKLGRSKTYYQYLLSYVALLLIVVIALTVFSQGFFVVQLREHLEDAHHSRLRQTVQQLDNDISQLYAIDYQISSVNENFLSYYLEDPSPMRDLRIVNEFKNLLAPTTLIAEIALVDANEDNVYTSTAVYAKSLFFASIFSFDDWNDPASDLMKLDTRIVRPTERVNGTDRYITFINAPSVFSRLQDAVLMFFIRETHFLSRLSPEDTPGQQGAIVAADGQIIVSTLPLTEEVTGSRYGFDGVEYVVFREPSSVMDWTYIFLLPVNETLAPIHRAWATIFVFMLAVVAAGMLVIHYAMRLNYKPIRELTEALGRSGNNDLESLKDAITSLSAQNENMRAQLMSSPDGQALKDSLLFSLLKGKFESFEAYNREAAPLGMTFDKPYYQVLMLRHFSQDEELPRPVLASALERALGSDYSCHFRELFEPSMIVCLIGLDKAQEEDLIQRCRALVDMLAQEHSLSFTIGASECSSDIRRITAACFEATQAVREYFVLGRHQLILYKELSRSFAEQPNYLYALQPLPQQTAQQRSETIRAFIQRLKDDQTPSLLAKSYCNFAVQMLVTYCGREVSLEDLFTISYLHTADDYLTFMLRMLNDESTRPPVDPLADDSQDSELLRRIRTHVLANYDDCNFSIQDAADKLELSSSYLSQYFKQQTGDTLTGYVASLRIHKACALLENTTMPLQMVSESVGYYNLNSFIRRFKQITGMTPGEYRKTHQ